MRSLWEASCRISRRRYGRFRSVGCVGVSKFRSRGVAECRIKPECLDPTVARQRGNQGSSSISDQEVEGGGAELPDAGSAERQTWRRWDLADMRVHDAIRKEFRRLDEARCRGQLVGAEVVRQTDAWRGEAEARDPKQKQQAKRSSFRCPRITRRR